MDVSPPAREVWIEIGGEGGIRICPGVASREGGVD